MINSALDFIRKNDRLILFEEIETFHNEDNKFIEEKIDLIEAIKQLETQYKTVIILRYYKDLSVKKIAEILKCPEGTIKTRLHRAIIKLKTSLKEGVPNE